MRNQLTIIQSMDVPHSIIKMEQPFIALTIYAHIMEPYNILSYLAQNFNVQFFVVVFQWASCISESVLNRNLGAWYKFLFIL